MIPSVVTVTLDWTEVALFGVDQAMRTAVMKAVLAGPDVVEPTNEPAEDTEAEVPDVQEDTVPE